MKHRTVVLGVMVFALGLIAVLSSPALAGGPPPLPLTVVTCSTGNAIPGATVEVEVTRGGSPEDRQMLTTNGAGKVTYYPAVAIEAGDICTVHVTPADGLGTYEVIFEGDPLPTDDDVIAWNPTINPFDCESCCTEWTNVGFGGGSWLIRFHLD